MPKKPAEKRQTGPKEIEREPVKGGTVRTGKYGRPKEMKRPEHVRLSAEESMRRMEAFPEREEEFIASVRKGEDRSVPARPSEAGV